jgi:hypothetical protein
MSAISWHQGLTWALSAFFALGFVINTFAVKKVGPEYERWATPTGFILSRVDLSCWWRCCCRQQ